MLPQTLAPIGVSTYTRLSHLHETLTSLRENSLAKESLLYVFSDGPRHGDEARVSEVRNYLTTISGFKKISIITRSGNNRTYNNRAGMKQLLEEHGKLIWLEEDVVTTSSFLTFMNTALEQYRNSPQIMSVSGWCPPIQIPRNYNYDAFFLRRFNAWGFGIWKDRFDEIRMETLDDYNRLLHDREKMREFTRFGDDMARMVRMDAHGKIDALDVKIMLTQYINGKYTVYPTGSYVRNIGFDGSGMHCRKTNRFDSDLVHKETAIRFPESVFEDPGIVEAHRKFRSDGLLTRIGRRLAGGLLGVGR